MIPTGHFNESYLVKTEEEREVVVRIAPPDDAGFVFYERGMMAQEPEIHALVRSHTSLPVPEVLAYDDSRQRIDRAFMVLERMPGKPLMQRRLPPERSEAVMYALGTYLRELHENCVGEAYGYVGRHRPMSPAEDWTSAFCEMWDRLVTDLEECGVYRPEDAQLARRTLTRNLPAFVRREPARLLHMDIWGQNVLVNPEGEITGILDWDRALWGDPEIEFAVLEYCGLDVQAFWDGYGLAPPANENAQIRRSLYHLYEIQKYPVIWLKRQGGGDHLWAYREYALRTLSDLA